MPPRVAAASLQLDLPLRQPQELHWVADGKTTDEIRVILGCSFFTVKNQLKRIFQHLNVWSRTASACVFRANIEAKPEVPPSTSHIHP